MMVKTIFQVTIIVLAKTVGKSDYLIHTVCFLLLFIAFLLSNAKFRAFNYKVLSGWHIASLIGILWLEILNLCDRLTSEHLIYVILLFSGWAVIAIVAQIIITKKFESNLYFDDNPDLDKLYAFNFQFWAARTNDKSNSRMFRSENIYNAASLKAVIKSFTSKEDAATFIANSGLPQHPSVRADLESQKYDVESEI
jgi:hypothetical protein